MSSDSISCGLPAEAHPMGEWLLTDPIPSTRTHFYGAIVDATKYDGKFPTATVETLAAKLIFADRVIRVHWSGRVEVEPR